MPHYLITLTCATGFTEEHIEKFKEYFVQKYDQCLAVTEAHVSGKLHVHAVVKDPAAAATSLTKKFVRLYEKMDIPVVKRVSINVKTAKVLDGALQYIMKDLDGQPPLLIRGWDMKTLEDQALQNLKKMPRCLIQKNDYYINQRVATSLIIEFAKRIAVPILCKTSFRQVCVAMMKEGYQFDALKLAPIYVQILARSGYTQAAEDWIDSQLAFV